MSVVSDELDSYMYQTVGHQAVDLYAEALGLPLYRRTIEGSSLDTGREYSQRDGDEVEDLYHLLQLVKVTPTTVVLMGHITHKPQTCCSSFSKITPLDLFLIAQHLTETQHCMW